MNTMKFYVCPTCGNIVTHTNSSGVPVFCCGKKMEELVPNTVEASGEKHIPSVTVAGDKVHVNVGTVDHPMVAEHFIEWVVLLTDKGYQFKRLQPEQAPNVSFVLEQEKALAVYAYCNLHGLWKTDL